MKLESARKLAEKIVMELREHCHRIEIAGSIRRGCEEVGDVDLVIDARNRPAIEERIRRTCLVQKSGPQNLVAMTNVKGVQIDVWFSHPQKAQDDMFADTDAAPDNFGSLLLCRTGSTQHNIAFAERAKEKFAMHWNPHHGLYQYNRCVAGRTEEELYAALRLRWIEPAQREMKRPGDMYRFVNRAHELPAP